MRKLTAPIGHRPRRPSVAQTRTQVAISAPARAPRSSTITLGTDNRDLPQNFPLQHYASQTKPTARRHAARAQSNLAASASTTQQKSAPQTDPSGHELNRAFCTHLVTGDSAP